MLLSNQRNLKKITTVFPKRNEFVKLYVRLSVKLIASVTNAPSCLSVLTGEIKRVGG